MAMLLQSPARALSMDDVAGISQTLAEDLGRIWIGADLVVEVISESNRDHDFQTKMIDYAAADIPEYWIVDPEQNVIHIFGLGEGRYALQGKFGIGTIATSPSLPGLSVDVAELFRQAAAQA